MCLEPGPGLQALTYAQSHVVTWREHGSCTSPGERKWHLAQAVAVEGCEDGPLSVNLLDAGEQCVGRGRECTLGPGLDKAGLLLLCLVKFNVFGMWSNSPYSCCLDPGASQIIVGVHFYRLLHFEFGSLIV